MNTSKLLILVSTVTLLSACGGKKKSKPNMIKPSDRPAVVKTTDGYRLTGTEQCQLTDQEMGLKDVCTVLRDKIAANSACITDFIILFKDHKCGVEVDASIIEEKLAAAEISEDGQTATVHQDIKVDISEARVVFDSAPTVTTGNDTSNDYAHLTRDAERSDPVTVAADVEAYENSEAFMIVNKPLPVNTTDEVVAKEVVSEPVAIPAEVIEVEIAETIAEVTADEPNIRFFPNLDEEPAVEVAETQSVEVAAVEETSDEPNIRFFPSLADKAQVIESTPQVFEIKREDSKVGTITSVVEKNDNNIQTTVKVDASLTTEEKITFACEASYENQCKRENRGSYAINKCINRSRTTRNRWVNKCERRTAKKLSN